MKNVAVDGAPCMQGIKGDRYLFPPEGGPAGVRCTGFCRNLACSGTVAEKHAAPEAPGFGLSIGLDAGAKETFTDFGFLAVIAEDLR